MANDSKGSEPRFLQSLLQRGSTTLSIDGSETGDVVADSSLDVKDSGRVDGNIAAARVKVCGLVRGDILTRHLHVVEGGQVWGDIYALSVNVEPGGSISGWVHILSEQACDEALTAVLTRWPESPEAVQDAFDVRGVMADGLTTGEPSHPLRRAREEAATAVLAHAELKEQFETRLQLEAGEAYSQIVHLEELVVDLRSSAERAGIELEQLRAQVGTEREAITDREEEIARLSAMLGKRDRRVEWLEAELAAAGNSVEQANAARFDSEQQLVDALRRVELLSGRVDSLDSALQASVQRNAEQEEALLHWQELAAATKARIAGLEERVAKYRERISETERELRVLRKRTTEKQDEEPSVGAIAGRGQERTITDERSGKTAGAERKIGLLEEELTAAKTAARERDEQLLWFKTSLAASENQRRSALEKWAEQERTVLRLRKSLAAERELVEQWKTRVGRLSELLYASERQVRPPAEEEHADVRSGGETKPDRMRAYEARIHVLETEIEQHREAFTVQAKRLAESRAALAETLVALNRARARLDEQSGALVAPETHVANEVPDEGRDP